MQIRLSPFGIHCPPFEQGQSRHGLQISTKETKKKKPCYVVMTRIESMNNAGEETFFSF